MSTDRIAEIRARYAASSPGDWTFEDRPGKRPEGCGCVVYVGEDPRGHELFDTFNRGYKESLVTPEGDEDGERWYDTRGALDLEFAAHAHQDIPYLLDALTNAQQRIETLEGLLNTPEIEDFDKAIPLEAAHQVERWGSSHDSGKNPEDWFWLIGYLAGKALASHKAGNDEKAKHHCISAAAALRNWHAHIRSGSSVMRPGIEEPIDATRKAEAGEEGVDG